MLVYGRLWSLLGDWSPDGLRLSFQWGPRGPRRIAAGPGCWRVVNAAGVLESRTLLWLGLERPVLIKVVYL